MTRKLHLKGEIDSPDGKAPAAAWRAVEAYVRRPEDVWIAGDPESLLARPEQWLSRLEMPKGAVGLRTRFVVKSGAQEALDFLTCVTRLLSKLERVDDGFFFHAEIMEGPESGIYFAYENRSPAFLTQTHFQGNQYTGTPADVSRAPLHINILLHDMHKTFTEAAAEGTLVDIARRALQLSGNDLQLPLVRELTLGRSDAYASGISVGIENMRQEKGAQGGFTATEASSRTLPNGNVSPPLG